MTADGAWRGAVGVSVAVGVALVVVGVALVVGVLARGHEREPGRRGHREAGGQCTDHGHRERHRRVDRELREPDQQHQHTPGGGGSAGPPAQPPHGHRKDQQDERGERREQDHRVQRACPGRGRRTRADRHGEGGERSGLEREERHADHERDRPRTGWQRGVRRCGTCGVERHGHHCRLASPTG
ncbi:hypothetical protein [Salana multivorans]